MADEALGAAGLAEQPAGLWPRASLTTYIVWLVRIVLPILFFWIWYRNGPGKDSEVPGPTGSQYTREELMAVRRGLQAGDTPQVYRNLKIVPVPEDELPGADRPRRDRPGGKSGGKGAGRGRRREGVEAIEQAAPSARVDDIDHSLDAVTLAATGGAMAPAEEWKAPMPGATEQPRTGEERMHLESLLNFVAFAHKDRQQRVFLPEPGCQPPPPRKRPPPPGEQKNMSFEADSAESAKSAKANMEAQMVLKGLINKKLDLKRSDIANDLYQQLADSQVRVSESTFSLMVEVCINAGDLKGASSFLMKMEENGHCPDSELLDKVMDLYSQSRTDAGSRAKAADAVADAEVLRVRLRSAAEPFRPGGLMQPVSPEALLEAVTADE